MDHKRILIAGAGSIGTVLGFYLQQAGHEVILLRKRGNTGRISINIVGVDNSVQEMDVISTSNLASITPELIILGVQRQQLTAILNELKPVLGKTANQIIVSSQNGLNVPKEVDQFLVSHKLDDVKILQSIIWWSATLVDENTVLYHNKADTVVGSPKISHAASESTLYEIYNLLLESFAVILSDDIELESKKKLILNIVSPILALLKKPYPTALNDFTTRKIVHAAFDEVVQIALSEGWFSWDQKLRGFHSTLASETNIDHYSLSGKFPPHKVSTQISAEKYGGVGSNAKELLTYFIERGSNIAKMLLELVLKLDPNYSAMTSDDLYNHLKKYIRSTCVKGND